MTVTTNTNKVQALGNGLTKTFPYSFRIYSAADLVVTSTNLTTGVDTPLVLNTDYTVTGAGSYNGGTVVLSGAAPDSNTRITIRRVIAVTQGTDLRNQGSYFAETHEDVFDRLTMIDQQQQEALDRSIAFPATDDPATHGDFPPSGSRANNLLGFDADGKPVAVAPAAQSATALQVLLSSSAGASNIGYASSTLDLLLKDHIGAVVASIAALRALDKTKYTQACVTGYYAAGDGGGGIYYYDAADSTSTDNGGTIIVASDSGRWKLSSNGIISVKQFGAKGDGVADDTARIQAAINYVRTLRGATLYFPANSPSLYYKVTAPLTCDGSIKMIGDGETPVTIMGVGLSAGQYILDFNLAVASNYFFEVEGLTLRSNNGSPNAMRLKNASYFRARNVQIYNVYDGIVITGTNCFSNFFDSVTGYSITHYTVKFESFTGGGQFKFSKCTFSGDIGVYMDSASLVSGMGFDSCNWEQCVTNSMQLAGTIYGLSIVNPRTEGCNGSDFILYPSAGNKIVGVSITGGMFTRDAAATYSIVLGGNGGVVRGFEICGNTDLVTVNSMVQLNGDGESGVIAGNYINTATGTACNTTRTGVLIYSNENTAGKITEYWGAANWGVDQGTWTPTDASGAGLTFTAKAGRYTKIGRAVFWQADVVYPTTANGANAIIGGLPYSIGNGTIGDGRAGGVVNVSNAGVALGLLQGIDSTTSVSFYNPTAKTAIANSALSGKEVFISGMYMT